MNLTKKLGINLNASNYYTITLFYRKFYNLSRQLKIIRITLKHSENISTEKIPYFSKKPIRLWPSEKFTY